MVFQRREQREVGQHRWTSCDDTRGASILRGDPWFGRWLQRMRGRFSSSKPHPPVYLRGNGGAVVVSEILSVRSRQQVDVRSLKGVELASEIE